MGGFQYKVYGLLLNRLVASWLATFQLQGGRTYLSFSLAYTRLWAPSDGLSLACGFPKNRMLSLFIFNELKMRPGLWQGHSEPVIA